MRQVSWRGVRPMNNNEADMDVIRIVRLTRRIREMLKSKPDKYIAEQLIKEKYFLDGLITGLSNDNVADSLNEVEEFLNDIPEA